MGLAPQASSGRPEQCTRSAADADEIQFTSMPTQSAPITPPRRYLDNAATSWPKPECVWRAWQRAARENGVAAGRGGYREAVAADQIISRARAAFARLLDVPADRIALPASATLGLNQAIHGLLQPGDHAIATAADHNATLRPLHQLARQGGIELTVVPCDGRGWVDPQAIADAWRPATRLVSLSHASNVTGTVQDAAAVAAITGERGGIFLLDASQSLGQRSFASVTADIVVAPAHKWLLGMHGIAGLFVREGLVLKPLLQGGTGSASESLDMPTGLPEQLEVGTADLPAAAALVAAAEWRAAPAHRDLLAGCCQLARECHQRLAAIPGVRMFGGEDAAAAGRPPIVSFVVEGFSPAETAALLEQLAGVQVRAGFHCAAAIHQALGTAAAGTVRVAFGPFNTTVDLEAVVTTVEAIIG